jgi:hypothetical protein
VYEPDASVYHYHGIHQDGDMERCQNVVRIIENLNGSLISPILDPENMQIFAIIPHRGQDARIGTKSQLGLTIDVAIKSDFIKRVFVSTDSSQTAEAAKQYGAEVPFLRSEKLSQDHVGTDDVVVDALERLESIQLFPDLIVYLEPTFPFRPPGLLDAMIKRILVTGLDTVIAGRKESGAVWHETGSGEYIRVDSDDVPRMYMEVRDDITRRLAGTLMNASSLDMKTIS